VCVFERVYVTPSLQRTSQTRMIWTGVRPPLHTTGLQPIFAAEVEDWNSLRQTISVTWRIHSRAGRRVEHSRRSGRVGVDSKWGEVAAAGAALGSPRVTIFGFRPLKRGSPNDALAISSVLSAATPLTCLCGMKSIPVSFATLTQLSVRSRTTSVSAPS
jgi:hypothetical protein